MNSADDEQTILLRSIRTRQTIQMFILITVALFFAKEVLLPIVLGLMIALTFSPVSRSLTRLGIPAGLSAAILIVGLTTSVGTVGYVMSGPIATLVAEAPSMGRKLQDRLRGVGDTVDAVQKATGQVEEMANAAKDDDVQQVTIKQPGLLSSAVDTLASVVATTVASLILALFLLASGDMFYVKLVASFERFADKKRALKIVYEIERKASRYLLTITAINAALGFSIGCALFLLGLPTPYIWGVLAFLLNFLPYIGMAAGTAAVAVFSIASFESLPYALLCPAAYFTLSALEGQIVTPAVVGRRLELNTVSVFMTVLFWGWLWGIVGALLAVPFLVFVKVVSDNIEGLEVLGRFLGAREMPDDSGSEQKLKPDVA